VLLRKIGGAGQLLEKLSHLSGVSLLLYNEQDSPNGGLSGLRLYVCLSRNFIDEALNCCGHLDLLTRPI
jgi:hypothetical protein